MLATVDDFAPTAIEERDGSMRVFFETPAARDAARFALAARCAVAPITVSDEDWARRSQENLTPITIGRVTVCPNPQSLLPNPQSLTPDPCSIVIAPSMGFGTGHHATTRLCLQALQAIDLTNGFVLDVGTGSGVLAIAAVCLGAAEALGIDTDEDAIQSARENLALNPDVRNVTFDVGDVSSTPLPAADVITANLTGALLVRSAITLLRAARPGGTLILSGLQSHERNAVVRAFLPAAVVLERTEDEWVGLMVKKP
jgi:ribosomal protein L11 methyltransferase